jgi:hypothetical protein
VAKDLTNAHMFPNLREVFQGELLKKLNDGVEESMDFLVLREGMHLQRQRMRQVPVWQYL